LEGDCQARPNQDEQHRFADKPLSNTHWLKLKVDE
jgi:hypothetical protein